MFVCMKVILLLCHPQAGSFNHAVAQRASRTLGLLGHEVLYHDLYAEGFDPVLRRDELRRRFSFDEGVQRYCAELEEAGGMVMVHPDWWGGPPALLKGWIDRVFRPGVAYEFEGEEFMPKGKVPLFSGKKAAVFYTTDEPLSDRPSPLELGWREKVFGYCGLQEAFVYVLHDLYRLEHGRRTEWLDFVEITLTDLFPPSP